MRRYKFREAVKTDIGLRRNENQDAYGIAHTCGTSLFVVADGMGGARGGATASAMAIHVIINEAIKQNGLITRPSLKQAIEKANAAIYGRSKADEDLSGMGTTVVALAFVNECAIIAHVGDSRIYRLRDGEITQLTRDHTLVQELVDSGAIPPEEAENHPIAHMLTRSLGPAPEVEVEIQALIDPTQAGDKFLLCSDGLYNLVSEEEICEHMQKETPEEASNKLIALALERGGTDNVTIETLEVCAAEDESLVVEYPNPGEVHFVFSEGVTTPELRSILEQQLNESGELDDGQDLHNLSGDTLRAAPAITDDLGQDEEAQLEEVAAQAMAELDDSIASPAVVSKSAQMRMQASVFFVVGVTAGIFGLFLYQYSGIQTVPGKLSNVSPKTELQPDSELAVDLTTLQNPTTATAIVVDPVAPGVIPSMVDGTKIKEKRSERFRKFVEALSLPSAPEVQVRDPEIAGMKPTRPIVWDNEERKIEEILSASREPTEVVIDDAGVEDSGENETLLTSEEKMEIIREKQLLRDRIADVDSKLRVLSIPSKSKAIEIAKLVNSRVVEKSDLIVELRRKIDSIRKESVIWNSRLDLTRGGSAVRLIEEISLEDESIRPVFDAYSQASQAYDSDMEQWTKNANDFELSQRMGASGKERDRALNELQHTLAVYVKDKIKEMGQEVAELRLQEELLIAERDQMSRFEGYIKGFTSLSASRRKELRDGYYKERGSYAEKLKELTAKIGNVREVDSLLNRYHPDYSPK